MRFVIYRIHYKKNKREKASMHDIPYRILLSTFMKYNHKNKLGSTRAKAHIVRSAEC